MYEKDGNTYFIVDATSRCGTPGRRTSATSTASSSSTASTTTTATCPRSPRCGTTRTTLYQGGERLMKDLFADGYVDHAIFQPALPRRVLRQGVRADRGGVRAGREASGQADLQPRLRPAQRRGGPGPAARGRRAVRPEGRQALHRRVARRLARLASSTTRGRTRYFEACRELGIKQHPRAQGPDHPAAGPRRVRRRRRRPRRHRLHRPQLHRRALRPAPAGGLLLDRHPGAQRARAAWPWRCRSSTPGRGTSRRSSASCCTGSARTGSSSPVDYALWTPQAG